LRAIGTFSLTDRNLILGGIPARGVTILSMTVSTSTMMTKQTMMSTVMTRAMRMGMTTLLKRINEDLNGLDCSSEDDDDNLIFDADLEEFELVDFADPNGGNKDDWHCYKDGPLPPDYMSTTLLGGNGSTSSRSCD